MAELGGYCDDRLSQMRDEIGESLDRGTDHGASFAIAQRGTLLLDLWGGSRDTAGSQPWEADTLVRVASSSKIVTTIAVLMLWDRGALDIHAPIATYWPEFAQNDKGAVTTYQVLLHNSGLPGFGQVITRDDFHSWSRMIGILERAPLWYEPGSITCYHSITYGFILGELIQRVSGRKVEEFVAEEITGPLGADFHYTLRHPDDVARLSELQVVIGEPRPVTEMQERIQLEVRDAASSFLYSGEFLEDVDPGMSGMTNARAMAKICSIMAMGGEVGGRRFLRRATVEETAREHSWADDRCLGWISRGLFFGRCSETMPLPTPTTLCWGGIGGSWATMDPVTGISCAYTPSRHLFGDLYEEREAYLLRMLYRGVAALA